MYCYSCTESLDVSTKTISTDNVSDTPVANYAKSTGGAARITFLNTSKTVISGSNYGELITPTRSGYTFLGWYTELEDGTEVTADTIVTALSDYTLYAHWQAN